MAKRVVVPIAQGVEEIEAVTVIDILRRAGVDVTVAGVTPNPITGRNNIKLVADCPLSEVKSADYDMVVLPGGAEGTKRMLDDAATRELVADMAQQQKLVGAICAAPAMLSSMGLLKGKAATSHPSVEKELNEATYRNDRVVIDGTLITSRGPGTAMEFAVVLVALLVGKDKANAITQSVLAKV
jgi:4-methyl-5(b-hydroxyethyl)-thiazole monophosphate biosynthesis